MIISFSCKQTESIWKGVAVKKWPLDIQNTARRKLRHLNSATSLQDLRLPPSNKLEKLKGNKEGRYSIRVNKQWRLTFEWNRGQIELIKLEDYH